MCCLKVHSLSTDKLSGVKRFVCGGTRGKAPLNGLDSEPRVQYQQHGRTESLHIQDFVVNGKPNQILVLRSKCPRTIAPFGEATTTLRLGILAMNYGRDCPVDSARFLLKKQD